MARLPTEAKEAFAQTMTAKFMATHDEEGMPNIAMISTTTPWDDDHLIFGDFLMWRTKRNLEAGSPVSVSVLANDLRWYEVRGRFLGFERSGEKFDAVSRQDLFRYSAIGLLRAVGTIAADEVYCHRLSAISTATRWLLTRIGARPPTDSPDAKQINAIVAGVFSARKAAKFLAVSRDGHLEQFPVIELRPVGGSHLALRPDLPLSKGDIVAISAVTPDLKAFQIKGEYLGAKRRGPCRFGYVKGTTVLSQTPPLVSHEVPAGT
jgi:hypothetical protein